MPSKRQLQRIIAEQQLLIDEYRQVLALTEQWVDSLTDRLSRLSQDIRKDLNS